MVTPLSLPLSEHKIIAPYWADVDIIGTGNIYYRQTTDPSLLTRANSEIRAAFPESLNISSLLIATWNRVGYYFQHTEKVHSNMAVHGIFLYHCQCLFGMIMNRIWVITVKPLVMATHRFHPMLLTTVAQNTSPSLVYSAYILRFKVQNLQ